MFRVLGLLGITAAAGTWSREAMAHQDESDPLAGTTIEQLSGGVSELVPDRALVLLRVTMEPGVVIPPHSHPGPVALYVEQGTFGTEFIEGSGTVQPQPKDGTPVPAIEIASGDDIQMPAGDHLFYDGAVHTMRNDGDDTLILLVAALFDSNAPGFEWQDGAATPAG
jgi:quercetin dioxygenase-like cupin family protein